MNQAGKSTRKMARQRRRTTNLILIGALILAILLFLTIQNWQALGLGGGTVLILLVILRVLPDLINKPIKQRKKEERRANRGARAEEVVGDLLASLGDDFLIIHDIPSSYGNIDHVVIGKNTGIFLLETKAHGGKVDVSDQQLLVNGKFPEKDFVAQALKNTYWLRDEIEKVTGSKVWITPVIVFTNAFVAPGKPIKGVIAINKKYLPNVLHRRVNHDSSLAAIWDTRQKIFKQLVGEQQNA